MRIAIEQLMDESGVKFGTSGARGLADALTDRVAFCYTTAFVRQQRDRFPHAATPAVVIGGDLRPSTPRIMAAVAAACAAQGCEVIYAGFVPSPAVALAGLRRRALSIMVTGSHIPDDRNGIKFNRADGEIDKEDERDIKAAVVEFADDVFDAAGALVKPHPLGPAEPFVEREYLERFTAFFPSDALLGLRVGVYQHSTVGRDLMVSVLEALGAKVTPLGRSDKFVPVDTEALRQEDVTLAAEWARSGAFDALVSADGDCDRPLVSDGDGQWLRGDVLGVLCAAFFGARAVATPISCNSVVEKCGFFERVERTRIGSPFVIEAMRSLHDAGVGPVVGYEANGGFLQHSPLQLDGRVLSPLPTRDALLPILGVLARSRRAGVPLKALVAELPSRFTASDRRKDFPTEVSLRGLAALYDPAAPKDLTALTRDLAWVGSPVSSVDLTDGLRVTFSNDEVVHLRPSGNAPELRCYTEADSDKRAQELLSAGLAYLASWH